VYLSQLVLCQRSTLSKIIFVCNLFLQSSVYYLFLQSSRGAKRPGRPSFDGRLLQSSWSPEYRESVCESNSEDVTHAEENHFEEQEELNEQRMDSTGLKVKVKQSCDDDFDH